MLIDLMTRSIAKRFYTNMKQREKRIGYSLHFDNLSKDWISVVAPLSMDQILTHLGVQGIGINYFTMGVVQNGCSSRYDPHSKYFQSWLGGYLVSFREAREWSIDEHSSLATTDQIHWLEHYGDKGSYAKVISFKKLSQVKIGEFKGDLYSGVIESNADVAQNYSFFTKVKVSVLTNIYNFTGADPKLSYKTFLPKVSSNFHLKPYGRVTLKGYIIVVNIEPTIKAVLYVNATEFTDLDGTFTDHFSNIQDELLQQLSTVSIKPTI